MNDTRSPKDRLFQTAARLFYRHGYRATGVDTIASESGIGKMTLYRHYPAKDELIVAFLRQSDRDFWEHFERSTQGSSGAREKLLAFFQALQRYVTGPDCYGCPFINAASEYPQADHSGHQIALQHKQAVRERFRRLAEEAGVGRPQALADSLLLLMDGAYVASRMYGASEGNPAAGLAETARLLIDASCPSG